MKVCNTPKVKKGTPKLCGFFVDYQRPFLLTPGNSTCCNFQPQLFPCFQTCFYWTSVIQKDVCAMTSFEQELHVAAQLLTNFKHLKRVSTFLLILDKKQLTYKISKERRIAIASVVGLDNLR